MFVRERSEQCVLKHIEDTPSTFGLKLKDLFKTIHKQPKQIQDNPSLTPEI